MDIQTLMQLDYVLMLATVLIYAMVFSWLFHVARLLYGGRYTNALPFFVAGVGIMLVRSVFMLVIEYYFVSLHYSDVIDLASQGMQIVAGCFLIFASYQVYLIHFATTGFFGVGGSKQ